MHNAGPGLWEDRALLCSFPLSSTVGTLSGLAAVHTLGLFFLFSTPHPHPSFLPKDVSTAFHELA